MPVPLHIMLCMHFHKLTPSLAAFECHQGHQMPVSAGPKNAAHSQKYNCFSIEAQCLCQLADHTTANLHMQALLV